MDSKSLIHHDDKPKLLRALLLRHRHVNENAHGFPFGARRKFSSYTSLQVIPSIECCIYSTKFLFILFWENFTVHIIKSHHTPTQHTHYTHDYHRDREHIKIAYYSCHSQSVLCYNFFLLFVIWCPISASNSARDHRDLNFSPFWNTILCTMGVHSGGGVDMDIDVIVFFL